MVVAVAVFKLLVALGVNSLADLVRSGEVKWRAGDRGDLAGRDEAGVHRGHLVRAERQLMIEDRAFRFAVEVEVNVLGEVDGGLLVGDGLILDPPDVFRSKRVGDLGFDFAGKSLVAVGARGGEDYADIVAVLEGLGVPDLGVPAGRAAVQAAGNAAGLVVGGQTVGDAVNDEETVGNAVAVAADDGAEIGIDGLVAGDIVEAQGAVLGFAVLVRQIEADDFAAVVYDIHDHAAGAL